MGSAPFLKAYDPDEPRIPAGNPSGGEWSDEDDGGAGAGADAGTPSEGAATAAEKPIQVAQAQTCQDFIVANCKASILRIFPGQFLNMTVDQVNQLADQGDADARTAKKLLSRREYRK